MISLVEINHFSKVFGVAAETIEKDYMISWILCCLSRSAIKQNFVFYGGTAIKRIYFEEHRFSEDIDLLTTHKFSPNYFLQELTCLEYAKEKANITLKVNADNIILGKDRIQLYINYIGFDEIIGAPKEIRLDFAMDMCINGKLIDGKMIESYSDLKNHHVRLSVMSLNAILATKLGLLIETTRNEPRDLYDIWFLLNRLNQFDYNFKDICETFNQKYAFYPKLTTLMPYLKNNMLKINWQRRLQKQLAEIPDIDKVIHDVSIKLQEIFAQRENLS